MKKHSIIGDLNWRYAVKKMLPKKMDDADVNAILEAIRLAPTSNGLQPFEVFIITNDELKAKLQKLAFNQSQVTECSHMLVFAAWNHYTIERIENYYVHYETERNLEPGFTEAHKNKVIQQLTAMTRERQFEHAARQTYIALGMALSEAAVRKVDSIPMEGFVNDEVDQLLQLEQKGLKSILLLPLGTRDEQNDWQAGLKKVRKPHDQIFTFIN